MATAREVLGPTGLLSGALGSYEHREGQIAMAEAVQRALTNDGVLICEAETGTGKTMAYLVPALSSGRRIVISTATKALQEQIVFRDVPLLEASMGQSTSVMLVKGLGNYLCKRRFQELRTGSGHALSGMRRTLPVVEQWALSSESGDISELTELAENDPIWSAVVSGSDTRIGAQCEHYDACFVTQMKSQMERAQILVVNHHLFFADLAVRYGSSAKMREAAQRGGPEVGVLPPYDAVIFDEAHKLEDIATDFLGTQLSFGKFSALIRDAERTFEALGRGAGRQPGFFPQPPLTALERASDAFFEGVYREAKRAGHAAEDGRWTLDPQVFSHHLRDPYHVLDDALEAVAHHAETHAVAEAVDLIRRRAERLREEAAAIVDPATHLVSWARFETPTVGTAPPRRLSIGASPVAVGRLLRERVFDRVGTAVLTSATLTTGQSFDFARRRLGLDQPMAYPVEELKVASPFDFEQQALLYAPDDLPEPASETFAAQATRRVIELVKMAGGGAFILTTSLRSMHRFVDGLRGAFTRPPLVQGDAPKRRLLEKFRAGGDEVLIATMGFWEGVDVPGHALRLVILDKLPFAVPSDPVSTARSKAIEIKGGNPFMELAVPQAAILLKQGFGRLIRSREDRGVVAILDGRLWRRRYGQVLLASLPSTRQTRELSEVREFFDAAPLLNAQSPGASDRPR